MSKHLIMVVVGETDGEATENIHSVKFGSTYKPQPYVKVLSIEIREVEDGA